jgi:hypothetical protein
MIIEDFDEKRTRTSIRFQVAVEAQKGRDSMKTQSMTPIMTLSEAIRLGSMLGPQIRGRYYGPNHSSCAIGAALLAIGKDAETSPAPYFPQLHIVAVCPSCNLLPKRFPNSHFSLWAIIAHLNDAHRWTRQQIADWVETIEQANTIRATSCPRSTMVLGRPMALPDRVPFFPAA